MRLEHRVLLASAVGVLMVEASPRRQHPVEAQHGVGHTDMEWADPVDGSNGSG